MLEKYDAFSGTSLAVRCYESHPMLKIGKGKLYGGSARFPKVKNADVYVVLQSGDMAGLQSDPWDEHRVTEIQYAIRDMHAPEDVRRFKKLVTWLCTQLQDGKTVHVGCIGGHGRTGTLLSAIVAEALGEKDAIQYVRKHYCKKVVEAREQVAFLMKHYGVTKVEGSKGSTGSVKFLTGNSDSAPAIGLTFDEWQRQRQLPLKKPQQALEGGKVRRTIPAGITASTKSYAPMASGRSLWKEPKKRKG